MSGTTNGVTVLLPGQLHRPAVDCRARVDVRTLRHIFFAAFGAQAALGSAWSIGFGLPDSLKWLDEIVLMVAASLLLWQTARLGRLSKWKLVAATEVVTFSLVAIASGVLNGTPVKEMILGWRSLAQFFVFYTVLVWLDFAAIDLQHFFDGVFVAALVQVPLGLRQFQASRAGYAGVDAVTAGFGPGTANLLGYFCALLVIVSLCLALIGRRWRYAVLAAPMAVVWLLTSANGSYVAFACVSMLALAASRHFRRFWNASRYAAIVALLAVALAGVVQSRFQTSLATSVAAPIRTLNTQRIDDFGNPGRVALMRRTGSLLSEEDRTLWFGLGTGSVGTLLGGTVPSNFPRFSAGTRAPVVSASVIALFAELGVLGLAMILLAWSRIGWSVWRANRRADSRLERAWLVAALIAVPFTFLAGCGEMTWIFQPVMYPTCALSAFAAVHRARGAFHRRIEPLSHSA